MIKTPLGGAGGLYPIGLFMLGAAQNVTFAAAGGANNQSTAFATDTEAVLISTSAAQSDVRVKFGTDPTATSTSTLLPKGGIYGFMVGKGAAWKLSVLSNDASPGSVSVTEIKGAGS
jgi:hypothetical protein